MKEREAFIVYNKCGGASIAETRSCNSQLVVELKQIINAEQDSKIPFVCWWVALSLSLPDLMLWSRVGISHN